VRHSVATVGLTAARHEAPGAVIVWDESDPPTPCPTSLIAAGGIRIRELHSRSSVESLVYSPSGGVVVIGLDGSTASQAAPLIKRLSDKDFAVIVYLKRAEDLSVAGRCGLLLAGCSRVADAGSPGFAEDLARHVIDTLYAVAERSAEEQRLRHTMTALGFVGQSAAMLAVFRRIVQLGRLSDLPTLITGETGTGKELVGRALHAQDPKRRSGPFVALNCSALSLGVVESELFGHRRGAFTSADRDRRGLIRAAEGGVLFLDEVSELERSVQTKLLRVLQESRVRAVGEEDDAPVSVRVLAATNRDLRGMVDRQEFRADLFHRLNVLSIHLPPIRERRADVPLLAEHFVRKHSSVNPAASRQLHPDVIEALSSLELPGNVRQLENVVRWALVQNDGLAPLGLRDLPADVWQQLAEGQPPAAGSAAIARLGIDDVTGSSADYTTHLLAANGWSLSRSLQACERLILETALREAHGNHSHVARRLGITARSVYNMVRRHQLA
jgi:transcriptional regulator with GAF, ATPase, and Fis domain